MEDMEQTQEILLNWLVPTKPYLEDRKFLDQEVTEELIHIAYAYTYLYTGELNFLQRMKLVLMDKGKITIPQARGILNCMLVELRAQEKRQEGCGCTS